MAGVLAATNNSPHIMHILILFPVSRVYVAGVQTGDGPQRYFILPENKENEQCKARRPLPMIHATFF